MLPHTHLCTDTFYKSCYNNKVLGNLYLLPMVKYVQYLSLLFSVSLNLQRLDLKDIILFQFLKEGDKGRPTLKLGIFLEQSTSYPSFNCFKDRTHK